MAFLLPYDSYSQRAVTVEYITAQFLKYSTKELDIKTIGSMFISEDVSYWFLQYRIYTQGAIRLFETSRNYVNDKETGMKGLWIHYPPRDSAVAPVTINEKIKNYLWKKKAKITPRSPTDVIMFYVHGGGFVMGSPWFYAEYLNIKLTALKEQGFRNPAVFVPDFKGRERNFQSDLSYLSGLWEQITAKEPQAKLVLAGDGSGGLLAMSLLYHIALPYHNIKTMSPMKKPSSVLLISPWTKFYFSPEDKPSKAVNDWVDHDFFNKCSEAYLGADTFNLNKFKCDQLSLKAKISSTHGDLGRENQGALQNEVHIVGDNEETNESEPSGDVTELRSTRTPSTDPTPGNQSLESPPTPKIMYFPQIDEIDTYMNPAYCRDKYVLSRSFPEIGIHVIWGAEEWLNDEISKLADMFRQFGKLKADAIPNQSHDFPILTLHTERIEELREDAIMYITGIMSRMLVANTNDFYEPGGVVKLKLRSLQKKKQEEQSNNTGQGAKDRVKLTPAQIRVEKDLKELDIPKTIKFTKIDSYNFEIVINPDEGYYQGGYFKFSIQINSNFPIECPKVKCLNKIYHPNIDLDGNICLNILREDWSPVLNLNAILVGLLFLFLEPNATDPLNKQSANVLMKDKRQFQNYVRNSMNGNIIDGIRYDVVIHHTFPLASHNSMSKQVNSICLELLLNQTVPLAIETSQRVKKQSQDITERLEEITIKDLHSGDVTILNEIQGDEQEFIATLEEIGYNIGLKASEFINYENPDLDLLQDFELLNAMKFICRDVWKYLYGKQIDNLRTNHKGTFVLIDNLFKPFKNFSSLNGDEETLRMSKLYTWLPSGIIKGALKSFDVDAVVSPEISGFPKVSFNIKTGVNA
ncbi:hypothetical protein WICPIJ_003399 [Wickerhamomyces pijperi]|uniref:NEDD8-conjugating enzyme UBC12 n=1 Tax=Wickerhamomyces pijperi TaxID=599730 RepID=A0A9P8Q788_WICPI|nr:hypothetical protein WICPIJ_003399 [Wickerhamomyces pijperi]